MKKKRLILLLVLLLIVIGIIVSVVIIIKKNKNKPEDVEETTAVVLNSIEEFNITLDDLDSDLYKKEYEELKENLQKEKIDYDDYAKSISKMFIIDLYSLQTKLNKYDVGGVQFVYPQILDNYKLNVEDTLYKYMEDNSKGKRKQTLPLVKSITVKSIKENKYKITSEDKTYEGYKVKLSWEYDKNLGYDDEAELILIRVDKMLYIVEKN